MTSRESRTCRESTRLPGQTASQVKRCRRAGPSLFVVKTVVLVVGRVSGVAPCLVNDLVLGSVGFPYIEMVRLSNESANANVRLRGDEDVLLIQLDVHKVDRGTIFAGDLPPQFISDYGSHT